MSLQFLVRKILQFHLDQSGPTVVEYAVLLALLVGAMMFSIAYVGSEAGHFSNHVASELDSALNN